MKLLLRYKTFNSLTGSRSTLIKNCATDQFAYFSLRTEVVEVPLSLNEYL